MRSSLLTALPPVLTVRQPAAAWILSGEKRIENRTWPTRHRGHLLIHAGRRRPPDPEDAALPLGCIVGWMDVIDCVPLAKLPRRLRRRPDAAGPWCWLLEDAHAFAEPVPAVGQCGLWRVPAAAYEAVARQLAAAWPVAPRIRALLLRELLARR